MDGARIFNAQAALNVSVAEMCKNIDTVTFCLSKGLGAPVGSVLCGSNAFILEARRKRKMLGGGLRQVGMLAAAGIIALTKMPNVMITDHIVAKYLSIEISKIPGLVVSSNDTNFIFFDVTSGAKISADELEIFLKSVGILCKNTNGRIRFVTHHWVTKEKAEFVISKMKEVYLKIK